MPLLTTFARPLILSHIDNMPATLADLQSSLSAEKTNTQHQDSTADFRVSLDLPGVKVKDLQINVEQDVLQISGFRRIISREGDTVKKNRFSYSVGVEEDTDLAKIRANLSDGVLVITAPKKPRPDPIIVPITTESHETFVKKTLETKSKDVKENPKAKEIEIKVQSAVNQKTHEAMEEKKQD